METSDYVRHMVEMIDSEKFYGNYLVPESRGVPNSSLPERPNLNNLNSLLHDIYLRYVALNDEEFQNYYNIGMDIFLQLHRKMKEIDPYYRKYSSTVQFAGSHPDHLRIKKPNEFDIDIVIDMPLNFNEDPLHPHLSDFLLQAAEPGYMQLKMGTQYQRLPKRDPSDWSINRRAYQWKDEENYLLRSKFLDWFKSVISRALNQFKDGSYSTPTFYVCGVPYAVCRSESGPAMTLHIENWERNIKLDIDLVVALRFPIHRWPDYRNIPKECLNKPYWILVPKLNKGADTTDDRNRSWRVHLPDQEKILMSNSMHLRQAIRLIKKLRDSQNMNKLASYYIKTLFFWEVRAQEYNKTFWFNNPTFLFIYMMKRLYAALKAGCIPYFWNPQNNLLEQIDRNTLNRYAKVVGTVLEILSDSSRYKEVAKYLLDPDEYEEYNGIFLNPLPLRFVHQSITKPVYLSIRVFIFICKLLMYLFFCLFTFIIFINICGNMQA